MFASVLGAILFAQSYWDDPSPKGRWAAPTDKLAAELLLPQHAADAVSHTVSRPIIQGGPPLSIDFFGRAQSTGDGFCARKKYYVSGLKKEADGGFKATSRVPLDQIRLGDCGGIYANLNPGADLSGAKKAVRWLEWAQDVARSSGPLQFKLNCRTEASEDRCANGGRDALAKLPLDKMFIVSKEYDLPHRWKVAVTETQPGGDLWDVGIDAAPGRSSIDMVWKVPAPF